MIIPRVLVSVALLAAAVWPAVADPVDSIKRPASVSVRSEITDRNGIVLARTIWVPSVYANPKHVVDPGETAGELAKVIPDLEQAGLRAKLVDDKSFVWIARHVNGALANSVTRLKLHGIGVVREPTRSYPQGSLVSHVVGYTDSDLHEGMTGSERAFNERLNKDGEPLRLSIDVRVQAAVRDELINSINAFHARGGAGLVLDARTLEVLALVSLPDFDPNDRSTINPNGYKDRLTSDVYEVGGLFDLFTTAMALDAHTVTPTTLLDVSKPLQIGRAVLRDNEPANSPVSVADAFARSSIIGMALIARRSSPEAQAMALQHLDLVNPMFLEPGTSIIRPISHPRNWGSAARAAIGYGYGVALTPWQTAAVATAVIGRGILVAPTLLRRDSAPTTEATRIISEQTAVEMRALMRAAVVKGTGRYADIPGYSVGGKTGTSLKVVGGTYRKDRRLTWFFAGFPMDPDPPQYTMLLLLDEPHGTAATHGLATSQWNAAPTAAHVIARIAPILGVLSTKNSSDSH